MTIGRACGWRVLRLAFLAAIACLGSASCAGKTNVTPDVPAVGLSPDEVILRVLEPYDPIYKLNFSGRVVALKLEGRRIPATVLQQVGKLTELGELSLYAANLTDESLELLQGCKQLHSLGLGATPITDKGLVFLEPITSLRHMWLSKELVRTDPSPELAHLKDALPELTIHSQ
ncbi:MAG: hypothetical protein QOK44_4295 [Betaproteobacteria bacterium]|nr:hypothetical protein [Betaproteobacteria bacterium]